MITRTQSPEETLRRWQQSIRENYTCTCDLSVGHICEQCHDCQVLQNLIAERNKLAAERERLIKGIDYWSYCMSHGMKELCPEYASELTEFLASCKISPWYIPTCGGEDSRPIA